MHHESVPIPALQHPFSLGPQSDRSGRRRKQTSEMTWRIAIRFWLDRFETGVVFWPQRHSKQPDHTNALLNSPYPHDSFTAHIESLLSWSRINSHGRRAPSHLQQRYAATLYAGSASEHGLYPYISKNAPREAAKVHVAATESEEFAMMAVLV